PSANSAARLHDARSGRFRRRRRSQPWAKQSAASAVAVRTAGGAVQAAWARSTVRFCPFARRVARTRLLFPGVRSGSLLLATIVAALAAVSSARAAEWLPHANDATWTYQWTDSVYNTTPTTEAITVSDAKGASFTLNWTTVGQGNSSDAPTSIGKV